MQVSFVLFVLFICFIFYYDFHNRGYGKRVHINKAQAIVNMIKPREKQNSNLSLRLVNFLKVKRKAFTAQLKFLLGGVIVLIFY